MRILFLTQTFPRFAEDTSGPFIRDLAQGLVGLGDEVTVLAPHAADLAPAWNDGGVEVRTFRYAPQRLELLGYSRSLEADEALRPAAAAVAPLYLAAARRAVRRELGRGERAHRPYDLVQGHWVVPNGLVAAAAGPTTAGGPVVATGLHGSDVFLAERRGVRRAVGWALARTRVLTGCSPELVDRVCALGFPRERAAVIPYGVDVDTFHPRPTEGARQWRRRLGVADGAPLVLSVGRMASKKGFPVLLAALPRLLAAHPESHWVLAGAGDLLERFRQMVCAMPGGERVHLPGAVLRDALPDLYRAADLFVLPAVHDRRGNVDGLPNVILEAMASGLPVVASAISGIPLAVADGVTGRLVPEADADALAVALDGLLGDREAARRLGRAGRDKAAAELTWRAVAARYRSAYEAGGA
ncbi:MAG TPA: glycosyltransferase [Thermoanaerobaculia bacterium]|nr:glycosyltransferase [Thermoanaerobaculia bacterium]